MDNALINTAATHETRNEPQEASKNHSPARCSMGRAHHRPVPTWRVGWFRLLWPSIDPCFLIVLLVGAVGMLVVGMVRPFIRLPGVTAGWSGVRAGTLSSCRRC